jgi:hypothetical protein
LDRWLLWLPALFAGGIVTYFALADEPDARLTVALLLGAIGILPDRATVRTAPQSPAGQAYAHGNEDDEADGLDRRLNGDPEE